MQETRGHKADQPGLRGHSHDPEQDLMKRFVVAKVLPSGGKLWLKSFEKIWDAILDIDSRDYDDHYEIIDQFDKGGGL